MKKVIAKHILGLIGVGILWFIVNQIVNDWIGWKYKERGVLYSKESDLWDTDIDGDGGLLLLGMLVAYVIIYWSVKTIWFDKDKDSQKGD